MIAGPGGVGFSQRRPLPAYQVFFVTLTGAPGSDAEQLSYHHERLKLAVRRGFGFPGLEHFKVITTEGNGVVHALRSLVERASSALCRAVFAVACVVRPGEGATILLRSPERTRA